MTFALGCLAGILITLTIAVALFSGKALRERLRKSPGTPTSGENSDDQNIPDHSDSAAEEGADNESGTTDLPIYAAAERLERIFKQVSSPEDLAEDGHFKDIVNDLAENENLTDRKLIHYARGECPQVSTLAIATLGRRPSAGSEILQAKIIANLDDTPEGSRYHALQFLHANAADDASMIPQVLLNLDDDWRYQPCVRNLENWITQRQEAGEKLDLAESLKEVDKRKRTKIQSIIEGFREEQSKPLLKSLKRIGKGEFDSKALKSIGRILKPIPNDSGKSSDKKSEKTHLIAHAGIAPAIENALSALELPHPRSIIFSGDPGTGKSATSGLLTERLRRRGYHVFIAGASELLAGQMYFGQLEGRMKELLNELSGQKVVWIIDGLQELVQAGRHRHSDTGILDMVLPYLERGQLRIVSEIRSGPLARLKIDYPRITGIMEVITLQPISPDATKSLGNTWIKHHPGEAGHTPSIDETILAEAEKLVSQYLPSKAAPGNLIEFLDHTWQRLLSQRLAEGTDPSPIEITRPELLASMAQLTGLPLDILDEDRQVDLNDLRDRFASKVLGQPEAVDLLIERVAMIKAGLTDPSRPLGVFLFAGGTGTGKTQVCKALAQFLFNSEERMIRLDMSEFQTPASMGRLLGEASTGDRNETAATGGSLVEQIRRHPFSLVLLDEFEKADSHIWDLFLQVFDDGRLTDRDGNTADFRNAIIILTSNLGASAASAAGIGFGGDVAKLRPEDIRKEIDRTFRPEFINRLDRVVIFRPLERETMREILHLELANLLDRRGLRGRPWVAEWEDSALDFLLDRGFDPKLGARPLRRAIDHHLLAPLSRRIVNGELPNGEQFLVVRHEESSADLSFEFLNAAAEEAGDAAPTNETKFEKSPAKAGKQQKKTQQASADNAFSFRKLILSPKGSPEELKHLQSSHADLVALLELEAYQERKAKSLARMEEPGFWQSPDRFAPLGLAETIDRVEASLRATGTLLEQAKIKDGKTSPEIIKRASQKIFLLEQAYPEIIEGASRDAFIKISAGRGRATEFASKLLSMYGSWAQLREMRCSVLLEEVEGYEAILAVSGYAALAILRKESGRHILDVPTSIDGRRPPVSADILVAPQPDEPVGILGQSSIKQAREAFASLPPEDGSTTRHYQIEPTPLVRDRRNGWRTGRLDLVLSGNFDLMG